MKTSEKKLLLCYGLLAAGLGVAYYVFKKPASQVAAGIMGHYAGLQVLSLPGQQILAQAEGNTTNYGYVYPAPNPMVALGRLRGLALSPPTVAPSGEGYIAFSTT